MDINVDTAQDYVVDYLMKAGCDPADWDVSGIALELVDCMDGVDVGAYYDDVPADVFAEMLEAYEL